MNYFEKVRYVIKEAPEGAIMVYEDYPHYIYINNKDECCWLGESVWKDKCYFPEVCYLGTRNILDLKVILSQKEDLTNRLVKYTQDNLDYRIKKTRDDCFKEIFQEFSNKRVWSIADKMKHDWTITGVYMKTKYDTTGKLEDHVLFKGEGIE